MLCPTLPSSDRAVELLALNKHTDCKEKKEMEEKRGKKFKSRRKNVKIRKHIRSKKYIKVR